jgi:hypothetical protein
MKYIFILVLAFAALAAHPQDFSSKVYYEYTGTAADTATNADDDSIMWYVPRNDIYLYRVEVELDEVSGSASGIAILQGSLNGSDWFEIDTLAGTDGVEAQTADGTVYIEDLSTGVMWRYLQVIVNVSTTGKWDTNYLRFRAVGKNEDD